MTWSKNIRKQHCGKVDGEEKARVGAVHIVGCAFGQGAVSK